MTSKGQAATEAARWIARRQSGELTREGRREFFEWLGASDENRAAYAQFESTLESFDEAGEELLADELERELTEEFNRGEEIRRRPRRAPVHRLAIAASVGMLIAGAAIIAPIYPAGEGQAYATAVGEQINVALEDGSIATLNTNSKIDVRYSSGKRKVEFRQGEALFEVARDAQRPFVVKTPLATIKVTGTTFDVRSTPHETMILVVSGSVSVTPKGEEAAILSGGEQLRVDISGAGKIARIDPARALSWRTGKAQYQDQPLGNVLNDLNRYFKTPIALSDASLAGMPVTGEFDLKDQETAVAALAAAFDLRVRRDADRIVLFH